MILGIFSAEVYDTWYFLSILVLILGIIAAEVYDTAILAAVAFGNGSPGL